MDLQAFTQLLLTGTTGAAPLSPPDAAWPAYRNDVAGRTEAGYPVSGAPGAAVVELPRRPSPQSQSPGSSQARVPKTVSFVDFTPLVAARKRSHTEQSSLADGEVPLVRSRGTWPVLGPDRPLPPTPSHALRSPVRMSHGQAGETAETSSTLPAYLQPTVAPSTPQAKKRVPPTPPSARRHTNAVKSTHQSRASRDLFLFNYGGQSPHAHSNDDIPHTATLNSDANKPHSHRQPHQHQHQSAPAPPPPPRRTASVRNDVHSRKQLQPQLQLNTVNPGLPTPRKNSSIDAEACEKGKDSSSTTLSTPASFTRRNSSTSSVHQVNRSPSARSGEMGRPAPPPPPHRHASSRRSVDRSAVELDGGVERLAAESSTRKSLDRPQPLSRDILAEMDALQRDLDRLGNSYR